MKHLERFLLFIFLFYIACVTVVYSQMYEKKRITMPSGSVLHLEVVESPTDRALGLMYRKDLPKNNGMLFVFPNEKIRFFWMKNTLIPLSIAFLNKQGTVVKIADMEPLSTEIVSSGVPCQYAIEVNTGAFLRYAVFVGTRLELPHVIAKE